MPFKSEKQRKWMWANEPKIAREWTDAYGSKPVKASSGGVRFGPPPKKGPNPQVPPIKLSRGGGCAIKGTKFKEA